MKRFLFVLALSLFHLSVISFTLLINGFDFNDRNDVLLIIVISVVLARLEFYKLSKGD